MNLECQRAWQLANVLLEVGLARTARRFLTKVAHLRNRELNSLRRLARVHSQSSEMASGVYSLVVDDGLGLVVPIEARRGSQDQNECFDDDALESQKTAFAVVARLIQGVAPDRVCLELMVPDGLRLEGRSLGLAASLAFFARLTGRSPHGPVLAMGEVTLTGAVVPPKGAKEKLEAAHAELLDCEGIVLAHPNDADLAPDELEVASVNTVEQAIQAVFGSESWFVDPSLMSLDSLYARLQQETDHEKAIRLLKSQRTASLPPSDRARLMIEQGTRMRHLGRTDEALRIHDQARKLFGEAEQVLGRADVENFEMQTLSTAVDQFDFDSLEPLLRDRLERPFATLHNEVRCRGMLAQVLTTTRRATKALELRLKNLEVQSSSETMRAEIPQTLCYIAWTAACADDDEAFNKAARRLLLETLSGDVYQALFTDSAIIRGLVRLGRDREALNWATGDSELWGFRSHRGLAKLMASGHPISSHPDVSTARALIRALRRTNSVKGALSLSARVVTIDDDPLIAWLAELATIEEALARLSQGDLTFAEGRLADVARRLETLECNAARFYSRLIASLRKRPLDAEAISAIEVELDWVYY